MPSLSCPHSTDRSRPKTLKPPAWRLFAVEACSRTSGRSVPLRERIFLRATKYDRRAFTAARNLLSNLKQVGGVELPTDRINHFGRSDSRLHDYGYRCWTDLFNDRQLLHLGLLARELRMLPECLRTPLGLAFSNHLTTNCMLTAYAAAWRRLTPLFSIRAFRHVPRPVELNPWTDGTGRGSFPNAVRQLLRAADFARKPKEPGRHGGFKSVRPIKPEESPRTISGNARDLQVVPSSSVDLVLTDPPYFDNVAYSELADFFQPWLEQLGLVPEAEARRHLVNGALRGQRTKKDSMRSFTRGLAEAFGEIHRVLKPAGLVVFTFRHSMGDAWYAMAKALLTARLKPIQVLPMPGETGTSLHTHDGSSRWDAVLVLRKLPCAKPTDTLTPTQIRVARENALGWHRRFRRQEHIQFSEADFVNLFRASLIAAGLGLYGPGKGGGTPLRVALHQAVPD